MLLGCAHRAVRDVMIKRRYGVMTARQELLGKVKLRAALALFVATKKEESNEEKEVELSFVAGMLATSACKYRVDQTSTIVKYMRGENLRIRHIDKSCLK